MCWHSDISIMPYLDKFENVCGFLDIEENEASNIFVRRFFMLDRRKGVLMYYMDNPQNLAPGSEAVNQFNLHFISIVGDAKRLKPKEPFPLYFTFAGKNILLRADSSTDKEEWIRILKEATKVIVTDPTTHNKPSSGGFNERQSFLQNSGSMSDIDMSTGSYQVEVVGNVVLKTEFQNSLTSQENQQSCLCSTQSWNPYTNQQQIIKKGFAIKQGLVRKNWKRRLFILTPITLSYFKEEEDKDPLKVIALADIVEARVSVGIHLNREHVLEVVTGHRVFYMQTETARERDSWIAAINNCIDKLRQPMCCCQRVNRPLPVSHQPTLPDEHRVQIQSHLLCDCCDYCDKDHYHKCSMNKSILYKSEPCSCSEKIQSSILCIRL